jgi:serine/threonine protein kinase
MFTSIASLTCNLLFLTYRKSDIFSLGATLYEICLGREQTLPENGPEWQNMRHGILLPMPNTNFELQMIIREMMAPEWRSRPSAEKLLLKRQLLSDEQRELIAERNKANVANMALDAQIVSVAVYHCILFDTLSCDYDGDEIDTSPFCSNHCAATSQGIVATE